MFGFMRGSLRDQQLYIGKIQLKIPSFQRDKNFCSLSYTLSIYIESKQRLRFYAETLF